MTERRIKRAVVVAVLVMLVVGVRLNQHDSVRAGVKAAKTEVRVEVLRATYAQDIESWHDRVAGCGRARQDRIDQRRGWRTARDRALRAARSADAMGNTAERDFQLGARATYSRIVIGLSRRIEPLDCRTANPKPAAPAGVRPLP